MPRAQVKQQPVEWVARLGAGGYVFYGANRELWHCREPEVVLSGPYETGKSLSALSKIHALCVKYPGCRVLLVRKLYSALVATALQTYYNKILPYPPSSSLCPVKVFGGGRPDTITYPNGSVIVVAGLDNADKVLSGEYDFIYANQAEELSLHDWEQLLSRATGRAGNAPYSQVIGDANPGPPNHWILSRPSITRLDARHEDNPALFDHETGEWTAQGKRTLAILSTMTGLRYKRGFLGLWAGSEGQIYESYDEEIHVIDPFPIPDSWPRYRVIDFGYTNPFVCLWAALSPAGVLYVYREIYMTGRIVDEHVNGKDGDGILALSRGETYLATICDHDAEDRATLEKYGIKTVKADKAIRPGIEAVQLRLRPDVDGRARLLFMRNSLVERDEQLSLRYRPTRTVEEFGGYAWPSLDGRARVQSRRDELPLKADDHGLDCLRYLVMYVDGKRVSKVAATAAYA
jgi:phage terminase large subunit